MLSSGDVPGDSTKLGQSKLGQSLYEVYLLWTLYTSFTLNVKIVSVRKPLPKILTKQQTQHQGTFSFGFNCDFRFSSMSLCHLCSLESYRCLRIVCTYTFQVKNSSLRKVNTSCVNASQRLVFILSGSLLWKRAQAQVRTNWKKNSLSILTDPSLVP